jgi:hypothetical protein
MASPLEYDKELYMQRHKYRKYLCQNQRAGEELQCAATDARIAFLLS